MKIINKHLLSPGGTGLFRVSAALFLAFALISCAGNKVEQSWGEAEHNKSPVYLSIKELLGNGKPVHIIVATKGSVRGVNKDFAKARFRQAGRESVETVETELADSHKKALVKDLLKNFGGYPDFKLVDRKLLASVFDEIRLSAGRATDNDVDRYNLLGATHIYYVEAAQGLGEDNYLNIPSNMIVTEKLIDIRSGRVVAAQNTVGK